MCSLPLDTLSDLSRNGLTPCFVHILFHCPYLLPAFPPPHPLLHIKKHLDGFLRCSQRQGERQPHLAAFLASSTVAVASEHLPSHRPTEARRMRSLTQCWEGVARTVPSHMQQPCTSLNNRLSSSRFLLFSFLAHFLISLGFKPVHS